jgi:signal transduction histidine kinase
MNSRTLLVVDDEPDMEMLIRQKFRKQIASGDIRFLFAQNGQQALNILENEQDVELVLTDINMPVMTGLVLLEKIAEKRFPCKCIVISAYTDIQNIRIAMNRGAFDFITKPIDFNDLETTIQKTFKAYDELQAGKLAMQERDLAVKDMEHAMASERFKQQFLANMSHEIRTPMNSVIGIAHLLLRTKLDDQQRKYIGMIQSASEQLMAIINDILDISKIEAGKMVLERIPFSIRQVVDNVRNMLLLKTEEKGLEFRTYIAPEIPETVSGDPSRLAQVLINLAGNAIKFTEKGMVEIRAGVKTISSQQADIEFSVTDTGIGIPQDKINSIFESFTQANSDTSRKYGGTGLGLTISKELVELHQGRIGLESKPGLGTRFFFNIPYSLSQEKRTEHTPEAAQDPTESLHGISVLLVEDNDFNRVVAEDTLNEYLKNVRIGYALNGREAVEQVEHSDFDLVLMDIQMPEMDGYEATRTIRSLVTDKRKIPIMAMTANATPEEIAKCFESGVDEYISKPFVAEELLQKMAAILRKQG